MCIGVDAKHLADRPIKGAGRLKVAGRKEVPQTQSHADSLFLFGGG
jgi:hypothetical protein